MKNLNKKEPAILYAGIAGSLVQLGILYWTTGSLDWELISLVIPMIMAVAVRQQVISPATFKRTVKLLTAENHKLEVKLNPELYPREPWYSRE